MFIGGAQIVSICGTIYGFWIDKSNHYVNPAVGTASLLTSGGIYIFSLIDVYREAKSYNSKLYHSLFKTEPPNISLNLYPTYRGVNLLMSFSVN